MRVEAIVEEGGKLPVLATSGAAGADVCAAEDAEIKPGQRALIKTGLKAAVPDGYVLDVRPRSGLAIKHGITVLNTPGTIDSDYRGEIGVILINHSDQSFYIDKGDRIAQLVLLKCEKPEFVQVGSLLETERGAGGFGHTGK